MPSSTRGVKRPLIKFVQVSQFVAFGWSTRDLSQVSGVSESDLTALGHRNPDGLLGAQPFVRVLGASSPKPARFAKPNPAATIGSAKAHSTYCAFDKYAAAQAAGWKMVSRAKGTSYRRQNAGSRTIDVICFLSNHEAKLLQVDPSVATPERLALLDLLTIQNASSAQLAQAVRGSNSKPAKVKFETGTGGEAILPYNTFSGATLAKIQAAEGYSIVEEEFVPYPWVEVPF